MGNKVQKPRKIKVVPSRRKTDKIRKILKLAVRLDDVRDPETLNALRNEIIRILIEIK